MQTPDLDSGSSQCRLTELLRHAETEQTDVHYCTSMGSESQKPACISPIQKHAGMIAQQKRKQQLVGPQVGALYDLILSGSHSTISSTWHLHQVVTFPTQSIR